MNRLFRCICMMVVCCAGHVAAIGADSDDVIRVDWSPLLTDNVGWNITSGGVAAGFVNAVGCDAVNVNMGGSWQFSWLNVAGAKYNNGHGQRFTVGLGIDWRNYKLEGGTHFVADGNVITTETDAANVKFKSSRLKVFSIELPVTVRQRIFKRCDVFAGVVTNFNVRASLENVWEQNGDKMVESRTKKLHQNVVTADVLAGVKYRGVGCYVRYSPFNVISKEHGPEFKTLSMGVVLGL